MRGPMRGPLPARREGRGGGGAGECLLLPACRVAASGPRLLHTRRGGGRGRGRARHDANAARTPILIPFRAQVQGLGLANASELLGTDGFRGAFVEPEAVYSELRSICLEWMMEGGSFSQLPERRQMCENEQYNCRDAVAGLVKFRHERVKTQIIERKPSNPLGGQLEPPRQTAQGS